MKRKLKIWLEKNLSGWVPYQVLVGGLRYYRATRENAYDPEQFLSYGRNIRIGAGVAIAAPERLRIGDNVGIDPGCYINAVGGCHIGKGCQIGAETIILTTEHQYNGGESLPYDSTRFVKPVYIEDYVWMGFRTCVAAGARIGEGAIIGIGSIVVQDVPPLAIVAGNPAQVLTYRSSSEFELVKEKRALIDPYKELPLLKVPPITKRKYKNELSAFGFDLSGGRDTFIYDKFRDRGDRLHPVGGNGDASGRLKPTSNAS
jgi:acetyltransferase-like isoleucine patch superfamily enzyme